MKTMSGSFLPPVVCSRTDVLCTFVLFACIEWCPSRIDYISSMVVSYRRQEMLTLNIMGDWVHPRFVVGSVLLIVFALFVFVMCLVYAMLPVPLNCLNLIAPSVFSNVY